MLIRKLLLLHLMVLQFHLLRLYEILVALVWPWPHLIDSEDHLSEGVVIVTRI